MGENGKELESKYGLINYDKVFIARSFVARDRARSCSRSTSSMFVLNVGSTSQFRSWVLPFTVISMAIQIQTWL